MVVMWGAPYSGGHVGCSLLWWSCGVLLIVVVMWGAPYSGTWSCGALLIVVVMWGTPYSGGHVGCSL